MPRTAIEDNRPDVLTDWPILAAKAVTEEADRVRLSERDSLRVLDLLENPPTPNTSLRAAAATNNKEV